MGDDEVRPFLQSKLTHPSPSCSNSRFGPPSFGQAPLFEGTDEEIAAAKKIQAMHRGRAARANVEKLKADRQAAKEEAEAAAKSLKLAEETAMLAAEAERELGEITGTEDEQQAAVKLQAMQRGRKARARVAELKAQKLAAEAAAAAAEARTEEAEVSASTAGAAEEEVSFEGTEEEHEAAAKLQAVQRGRAARAKLRAERAAAAAKVAEVEAQMAQTDAAEAIHFEGTEEEQSAATKLQAVHRGRKAREDVERLKKEKEVAAQAQKKVEEAQASATDEGASHLEMLVAQKAKFDEEAEQIEQELAECREENQEAIDAAEMEAAEAEAAAEAAEAAEPADEEPAEEAAEEEEEEEERGNPRSSTRKPPPPPPPPPRPRLRTPSARRTPRRCSTAKTTARFPTPRRGYPCSPQSSWKSRQNPSSLRLRYRTSTRR